MDNKEELVKYYKNFVSFLSNKKVQRIIVIILFLLVLVAGSLIRLQNLPALTDQTNGESIPLALDPFYFLRVSETMLDKGQLPEFDEMRYSVIDVPWTTEVTPGATVFLYKIAKVFNSKISVAYIHNLNPVIFFILGVLVFFLLIWFLTKSKWIAIISAGLLTIIPPYLYRTLAGFADHESIGMFVFFSVMLAFSLSIKYLSKKSKKEDFLITCSLGLVVGFLTVFSTMSWGGIAKFVFLIISLSFFIMWLANARNKKFELKKHLYFYVSWIVFSILFAKILGLSIMVFIRGYYLGYLGLFAPFVLIFILIDFFLMKQGKKILQNFSIKKRLLTSVLSTIVLSIIVYQAFIGNIFNLFSTLWDTLFHPFGTGRVGLTIAENKQPYLNEWWGQIGKTIFWLFYLGCALVGINASKGIKKKKNKILFSTTWIILISGILFSRISSSSALNGENFISQFVYISSILLFLIVFFYIYSKDGFKPKNNLVIIISWLILMLVAARGAIRLFFAIVPFACFMAGYSAVNMYNFAKKNKDEFFKTLLYLLFALILIGLVVSAVGFTKTTINQAKYTGPSANAQWQGAMSWVNANTVENGLFMHWWDYGYWVQYLGKRPTVTDGGHYNGYWDHLIGRYVLTTPNPDTAKSFAKTHNVSYLLIDQSDIGKYPAYSSIGSDDTGDDRNSWIPTLLLDPNEIQETRDGSIRFYRGGTALDQDIIYEIENNTIFLPSKRAFLGGFLLERSGDSIKQPEGIYIYNNQQIKVPIRYLFIDGMLIDFEQGVNATVYIFPSYIQGSSSGGIDNYGAAMYLSSKTKDSLFAQLFLMDDPDNLYPEFELVHSEENPYINFLKSQNVNIGNFVYYNGLRGPIKIWEITHSDNTLVRQEFLSTSGGYAELDNLQFKK